VLEAGWRCLQAVEAKEGCYQQDYYQQNDLPPSRRVGLPNGSTEFAEVLLEAFLPAD